MRALVMADPDLMLAMNLRCFSFVRNIKTVCNSGGKWNYFSIQERLVTFGGNTRYFWLAF